jgi:acetyl esterase/lipase
MTALAVAAVVIASYVSGDAAQSSPPDRRVIVLWPEGVPNAKPDGGVERLEDGRVYNVQNPTLTIVPPVGTPNGTAVIVCPGGGYARLAIVNEADGVAERLRHVGVTTFILKYRLAEYGHPAPLQDVLRAIRLVRARAAEFGLRSDRIGVMGASAGGHVAASAATLFDAESGSTKAAIDAVSARPDFAVLLYPVITMQPPYVHEGSRRNLLGDSPPDELVRQLSLEGRASSHTPPVFIVHAADDRSVPIQNSILFYEALLKAHVPAELHLYEHGPHGFGTAGGLGPTSLWVDRWFDWMRAHGWLTDSGDRQ